MTRASTLLALASLGVLSACKPDGGLTKFNSTPEAFITSPVEGDAPLAGTALTLRGTASDANHASGDLLARWFVDGVEVCASAAPQDDGSTACDVTTPRDAFSIQLEVVDPDGASATAERTLEVTANASPQATIVSPTVDGLYFSDGFVAFEATVSDAEDPETDLEVWWEDGATRLDAVESRPTADGAVIGYGLLAEGPHAIELHVVDTAGNETVETVLVEVGPPNTAPACEIVAPADGASVEVGSTVTFRGTATDDEQAADTLSVTWTSDKDGVLGSGSPTSGGDVSFPYAGLSADTHLVSMRVVDPAGEACTAEILLTVGSAPTLDVLAPAAGDTLGEGDTELFSATVSDVEDRPSDLVVRWESDLDGVLFEGPADSTGESAFYVDDLSVGAHLLTVTVTDTTGLSTTETLPLAVNGRPTAPAIHITPLVPYGDDDLTVVIDTAATDPEGDRLTLAYAWFVDGVASSASTTATLPASATTHGERWSVEVWASDGVSEGPVGTARVTIADTAPVLASATLTPDAPATDATLTCTPSGATDADGDAVAYTYAWQVDGGTISETGATLSGAWFDAGDTVACVVTPVAAGLAGAAVTSNVVVVANSAPSLVSASISPSAPVVGDVLTCSAAGWSDADGDADASTYAWTVDGVAAGTGRTLAGGFAGGDLVMCTVTPNDGSDTGAPVSASVTVANTAPVLASVTLSPSSPREADTLTCTPGTTTDADGTTAFTYAYAWTVNGATIAATSSTLGGTWFARGDRVACSVTPSDGTAAGASVASGAVTVANTAPALASVSITPAVPTRSSTLTCAASGASDADGDSVSVSYAWTVGGVAAGTGATLAGPFTTGAVVACTGTPSDGTDAGTSVSASVSITNAAPVVSSVSLAPASPATNDTITATVTSSDADGDSVSLAYAWYVNGTRVAATGSSLSGVTYFSRGDTVYVQVTPSDAYGAGSAVSSSSVTVANTAPTAPVVGIDPTSPVAGDDLICAIDTASSDADGDSIAYTVSWTVGGVAWTTTTTTAVSGDTVDGAYVDAGEVWACSVRPSDGTASGSAGTASATILAGGVVPGFSGYTGPTFSGWTQCEGYYDVSGGDDIPTAWGNDCTSSSYTRIKLACGASTSSYRYIDVSKNVFRLGLTGYPESGLITAARNQSGTSFTIDNVIYASGNHPHSGTSWWNGGDGCSETSTNITFNNGCSYEASNCFGQGISGPRYVWVYVQ